eukprot:7085346-Ditylum_brightwellii.AAC.1
MGIVFPTYGTRTYGNPTVTYTGQSCFRELVEFNWKQQRDQLIMCGHFDPRAWAYTGEDVINDVN